MSPSVDDIQKRWPWGRALGKFESVTPGKKIWYVHPKKRLQSVIVMRLKRPGDVNFKYRGASNDRISVDFPAGSKRILRDIPVTAADFNYSPAELNSWFSEQCLHSEQLFVLGLARAECQCPLGYNRLEELPDRLRRQVDVETLPKYCQILLIGVLPCPKGYVCQHVKMRALAKLPEERKNGNAQKAQISEVAISRPLPPLASRLRRRGKHGPRLSIGWH